MGLINSAVQDDTGLLIHGTWYSTSVAQNVRQIVKERLAAGKNVECSIGYQVLADEQVRQGGKSYRLLKSLELIEASIVAKGANPEAHVLDAKGAGYGRKEGRTISGINRDRLQCATKGIRTAVERHVGDLESLLDETDMDADDRADPREVAKAVRDYDQFQRKTKADPREILRHQTAYRIAAAQLDFSLATLPPSRARPTLSSSRELKPITTVFPGPSSRVPESPFP